jgi:hypothetical protein
MIKYFLINNYAKNHLLYLDIMDKRNYVLLLKIKRNNNVELSK